MEDIKYNIGNIDQKMEGSFKVAVVDANTNKVIWEQPEFQKNLILNNGMNQLPYTSYANLMYYGIAGTGTRVNKIDGHTTTVSQVGTTVTLSPDSSFLGFTGSLYGYSSTLEIGDVIVFATGSNGINDVMAVGSITGNTCTVNKIATISSTPYNIWKTSQATLQSEVKRAGNGTPSNTSFFTGVGSCGSTLVGNILTMQRTWDFAPEVSNTNYNEVGVGWHQSTPTSIFSRLLLPSPLMVDVNQRLRLSYQLQISINPTSSISRPDAIINGWTVNSPSGSTTMGSESIQRVNGLISSIDTNGNSTGYTPLEPSSTGDSCKFFISNNFQSLAGFNSAIDRTAVVSYAGYNGDGGTTTYQNAYVNNSFTVNKTAIHGLYLMNRNDIRSIGFGAYFYNGGYIEAASSQGQAFCFVFNTPQSKSNTQTLTMAYTWTWDRSYVA